MSNQMSSNSNNQDNQDNRQYLFSLKKIAPFASRKFEIETSYAPVLKQDDRYRQLDIVPRVMATNLQYINSFFLPAEQPCSPSYVLMSAVYFTKIKNEMLLEPQIIEVAIPRISLCGICKQQYEDYIEHTASKTHQTKQNSNTYTGLIRGLSKRYGQDRERHLKKCEFSMIEETKNTADAEINLCQSSEQQQCDSLLNGIEKTDCLLRQSLKKM